MFPTLSQQLGVKRIGEMDMDGRTIYVSDARINCREYFTDHPDEWITKVGEGRLRVRCLGFLPVERWGRKSAGEGG